MVDGRQSDHCFQLNCNKPTVKFYDEKSINRKIFSVTTEFSACTHQRVRVSVSGECEWWVCVICRTASAIAFSIKFTGVVTWILIELSNNTEFDRRFQWLSYWPMDSSQCSHQNWCHLSIATFWMNRVQPNTVEAPESEICTRWKSFKAAFWKWEGELTNCDRKYVLHTTQNTEEWKTAIPHSTFSYIYIQFAMCWNIKKETEWEWRKKKDRRETRNKIPS